MCCKRLYWRDVSSAVALSPILCGPSGGASARSTTSSVDPLEAPPTGPPVLGNRIFLAVLYQKSDRRSQKLFFWLTFSSGETQCLSVAPFFLLKWLQSKTSFILSDFFLWPPLPSCLSCQLLMRLCRKFAAGLRNNGYAMLQSGLSSSCRVAPRTETVLFC